MKDLHTDNNKDFPGYTGYVLSVMQILLPSH
jgi:hypothetical protein